MKNKGKIAAAAAVFLTACLTLTAFGYIEPYPEYYYNSSSYGYYYPDANYGPGYYPNYNNPAYDTGWSSGLETVGPGYATGNPMNNRDSIESGIYSRGPGSEEAQELARLEDITLYIYSTYQGGTWEQLEDGRWRLLKPDGQPVSSEWAYVDGKYYLLDMYGIMLTGFQRVNDNWYYLNSTGAMQTGWLLKNGKYYFLNSDGTMAYGWVNSQGLWYYLDNYSGVMLTNTYTPDSRYVNAEGVIAIRRYSII